MPGNPRAIYWDSNIFIHYIEATPEWLPVLDALLESASKSNEIVIYTSTVSITEVAFAQTERSRRVLDPAIEEAIDALWQDRSAVKLVEFDEEIARRARSLVRRGAASDRGLRPMDAIHLATAASREVDTFHTLDARIPRDWTELAFTVTDPTVPQPKLPGIS